MAPHEQARHPFGRRTVCQAHVLALLEQHCECDLCFQSSKSGADAEVGSLAESQMRAKIWPSDVRTVRIREGGWIAIGGAPQEDEMASRRKWDAA